MQEGIGTIITAIIRSRKIFRRLETYIIYRMTSSLVILVRPLSFPCLAVMALSYLGEHDALLPAWGGKPVIANSVQDRLCCAAVKCCTS